MALSSYSQDSSEDDDDVLQCLEKEASGAEITKNHVKAFDKMKKCRRYIEKDLSSDSEDEEVEFPVRGPKFDEEGIRSMLDEHVSRKRTRRRIRRAPKVSLAYLYRFILLNDHFILKF